MRRRAVFVLMSMLLLSSAISGRAQSGDATETPTPSPEVAAIITSVAGAVDGVDTAALPDHAKRVVHVFVDVNAAQGYDVTVVYHTAETDDFGYNAELIDLFRAIGRVMQSHFTPLGTLSLVPSLLIQTADGSPVFLETISVSGDMLNSFLNNDLSRSVFLRHWTREPGNIGGQSSPGLPM